MPDQNRPRRYFKLHFMMLRFLGLGWWHHSDENDTRNFPGMYIPYVMFIQLVWVFSFIALETIDPFIGEKDLDRFMFNLSFVVTHDLTLIKIGIFFIKNKEIQDIVRTLEIDMHQFYQKNDMIRRTVKLTRLLTLSFCFFGWMTILNSDAYGILQDLRWKEDVMSLNVTSRKPPRTLPQPIYIPWNYESEKSYILSFLLETVGLLWTGHIVIIIDTLIASFILQMSTQFSIIQESFRTAYKRTMKSLLENVNRNFKDDTAIQVNDEDLSIVETYYNREEIDSALEKTLKSCFKQYQMLVRCVEKFAMTYYYGFMTQLLSSMGAICVVMVQISRDASNLFSVRIVTSLAFFAAMIIQLALQCISGNDLTHQAGLVSEALMSSNWELMSPRLRRSVLLTMIRAQRPIRLSAAGFANMDNACFLAIMKAAYSYYAVLSEKQD